MREVCGSSSRLACWPAGGLGAEPESLTGTETQISTKSELVCIWAFVCGARKAAAQGYVARELARGEHIRNQACIRIGRPLCGPLPSKHAKLTCELCGTLICGWRPPTCKTQGKGRLTSLYSPERAPAPAPAPSATGPASPLTPGTVTSCLLSSMWMSCSSVIVATSGSWSRAGVRTVAGCSMRDRQRRAQCHTRSLLSLHPAQSVRVLWSVSLESSEAAHALDIDCCSCLQVPDLLSQQRRALTADLVA